MKTLITALLEKALITDAQLKEALEKQKGAKRPLQEMLVEMGFISEENLARVMSEVFGISLTKLSEENIDIKTIELLSYEAAKKYGVFPVRREGDKLVLAMSDPTDFMTKDDIKAMTGLDVAPILATKSEITDRIEHYYHSAEMVYDLLKDMAGDAEVKLVKENHNSDEKVDTEILMSDVSPVVKLLNRILSDAVRCRASDVHIEPQQGSVKVRYRIDGDLREIMQIPNRLRLIIAARAKIMAEMDIAESHKPQDGRIKITAHGRNIDLRVSTVPTHHGENIVFRILDPKEAKVKLDQLGFEKAEKDILKDSVKCSQGMILVTGPTGSGKTSTLYAALNFIKNETKNIITIEDPIEYLIDGINQIQVNPYKNITFNTGLRSVLRQDPNIILVGEIRDSETAETAFRASLTGHLVLSSLHTNSSVASITRLLDIGLAPYLIASSVILIIAQRLVRIICPHCAKETYKPDDKLLGKYATFLEKYGVRTFTRGKGCEKCCFTGFYGRTGLFEILKLNDDIRELITGGASEIAIMDKARKYGFRTIVESGMEKIAGGITTIEELARVTDFGERESLFERLPGKSEKPRILVADDEENVLEVLESRFKHAGYEMIKARDGKEAIELAIKEKPDLVVMDIMMPNVDGFEATRVLRSTLETALIPILMLTAKTDGKSELKGIDIGADDYVTKPFDGARLLARIKMLLKRRQRGMEL